MTRDVQTKKRLNNNVCIKRRRKRAPFALSSFSFVICSLVGTLIWGASSPFLAGEEGEMPPSKCGRGASRLSSFVSCDSSCSSSLYHPQASPCFCLSLSDLCPSPLIFSCSGKGAGLVRLQSTRTNMKFAHVETARAGALIRSPYVRPTLCRCSTIHADPPPPSLYNPITRSASKLLPTTSPTGFLRRHADGSTNIY